MDFSVPHLHRFWDVFKLDDEEIFSEIVRRCLLHAVHLPAMSYEYNIGMYYYTV